MTLENQEITKDGDDYLPAVEDSFGAEKQNKTKLLDNLWIKQHWK